MSNKWWHPSPGPSPEPQTPRPATSALSLSSHDLVTIVLSLLRSGLRKKPSWPFRMERFCRSRGLFSISLMVLVLMQLHSTTWSSTLTSSVDSVGDFSFFMNNVRKHNQEAMNMVNRLICSSEGCKRQHTNYALTHVPAFLFSHYLRFFVGNFVNEKDGVSVERRQLPSGSFVDPVDQAKGCKHACVRSSGVLNAPASSVFNLFIDNDRVAEYNEHCAEVRDIMDIEKRGITIMNPSSLINYVRYIECNKHTFFS